MSLERFVYCSRANFPVTTEAGLHPEVGRILMQSRKNNPRDGLVGGLYFANGWFFQCLEGPSEAVDALLARLRADARHTHLTVLQRSPTMARRFTRWSMKYVPDAAEVRALLKGRGLEEFEPLRFDAATTAEMVDVLIAGSDAPPRPAGDRRVAAAAKPRAPWMLPAAVASGLVALGAALVVFAR